MSHLIPHEYIVALKRGQRSGKNEQVLKAMLDAMEQEAGGQFAIKGGDARSGYLLHITDDALVPTLHAKVGAIALVEQNCTLDLLAASAAGPSRSGVQTAAFPANYIVAVKRGHRGVPEAISAIESQLFNIRGLKILGGDVMRGCRVELRDEKTLFLLRERVGQTAHVESDDDMDLLSTAPAGVPRLAGPQHG